MSTTGLESGYTRRALARLALSVAAAELADQARAQVPTDADRHARPGSFLEEALSLLAAAQEVVLRAAVLERQRGTSWEAIGEQLGTSRQAAQQRFGEAFERWEAALDDPLCHVRGDIYDCRLPDGADDPELHAARLDAWLDRTGEPGRPQRTVSAGLEVAGLVAQVADLLRQARLLVADTDPVKRQRYEARKARLLAAIAEAGASHEAELAHSTLAKAP